MSGPVAMAANTGIGFAMKKGAVRHPGRPGGRRHAAAAFQLAAACGGAQSEAQSAYRILVASSEAKLLVGAGDRWDSGRVASSEIAHVEICRCGALRRRCIGSTRPEGNRAASRIGRYCTLPGDAGRRPAALGSGCADESGRLTVGRSKMEAETRTVYLMPASVEALGTIRPADADGESSVFGLSAASISRRIRAAAAVAGLGQGFSGHSGRVGMAQGRWKTARMVEVYTRSEEAGRAAKWLA